MSWDPAVLARRVAIGLGSVSLANVVIEGVIAVVAGNPAAPPLATPDTRFLLLGTGPAALAQIVGSLGLITAGCWVLPERDTQRRVARAYLGLAGVMLLVLIAVAVDYRNVFAGLSAGGMLRLRIQFVRLTVFYATLSGLLWSLGRHLLARSRHA